METPNPPETTHTIDGAGNVTITPAPGFAIMVDGKSKPVKFIVFTKGSLIPTYTLVDGTTWRASL